MKVINIKSLFLLPLILFLFASCEKEIDLKLHSSEPRIVIEGLVQLDTLAIVKITMSKDYNTDNEYDTVDNATVVISDDLGHTETLVQNADGVYAASTIQGVVGVTYSLSVTIDGQEYTSRSTLPTAVPIDSITMYDIPAAEYPYPQLHFLDPQGEKNYYRYRCYVNGKRILVDYEIIETNEGKDGLVISDVIPVHEAYNDDKPIEQGDEITVELYCMDKNVGTYFEHVYKMTDSLTNPATNITGGCLGYFSAYAKDRKTIYASW
ncbi:DUF4249 domain-containing protein [Dysgonomonas sp. 25]|uniref:DUF4249 domain-containing protein n=1 Tax=Dysgonomonas sp. 25 TaxID=2302933 RepID=UPI0013D5E883|nr:DUF4249 domain-containing protein [Dysgonomonas sp. 25]NDV69325.1 DUF4249 domain-containing protein [Dysgonomonas sp. 25]